jgi:hypothetical protein
MFAHLLKHRLAYDEGEKDLLVMHHEFEAIFPDLPRQRIQSTLVDHGVAGGDSSMSRTVGYPVGIAAGLLADGKISLTGVLRPVDAQFYTPILNECRQMGISFTDRHSDMDADERSYWGD